MSAPRTRGPQPGTTSPRAALSNATAAWGSNLPEWIVTLAEACDRSSQNAVAKRLNYSGSVVSSVLNNAYKGGLDAVEQAVRGALMAETHDCPVLGEISKSKCLDHQKKAQKFQPTSSMRVQLYRACRGACPFSRVARKLANQGDQNDQ